MAEAWQPPSVVAPLANRQGSLANRQGCLPPQAILAGVEGGVPKWEEVRPQQSGQHAFHWPCVQERMDTHSSQCGEFLHIEGTEGPQAMRTVPHFHKPHTSSSSVV